MERLNQKRLKVAPNRRRINWGNPSPEDIAAGLGEDQQQALIDLRCDNQRGPHWVALDKPVSGWRDALLIKQGYGQPAILTDMGAKVRAVILAQTEGPA